MPLAEQPPMPATAIAPTLVLAIGNPSRGDDAIGPLLAERLQAWLSSQPASRQREIDVLCEQQLQVEHLLDLQGRERVLFVDAATQGEPTVHCRPQPVLAPPSFVSHACHPGQLLGLYQATLGLAPPDATLLTVTGEDFSLGADPSRIAQERMESAWHDLLAWLDNARP